ncbi:MgtC/SapB family protein [Thalassolituus sp. LLYu03]|uniref:MgtC/SapB family protein n=1 Tax=Thalassolituus sp. LLYu03 TaxID=3421656 RepID=UPI003D2DF758
MIFGSDETEMLVRLLTALAAGALIGYERSYHGRPAGFRTHTLVSLSACLLMLVTVYESHWIQTNNELIRLDPTRMAQGIMTGIGFLGAGVIMKEGISVRGLTTSASIWMTSAIGILAGIGFYVPMVLAVVLTIGTLSLFRWMENLMPSQAYYHFEVRVSRASDINEEALRTLLEQHGFSMANFSYRLDTGAQVRRHGMVLRTSDRQGVARLAETLEALDAVQQFRLTPTGD